VADFLQEVSFRYLLFIKTSQTNCASKSWSFWSCSGLGYDKESGVIKFIIGYIKERLEAVLGT
jgi:hypothetical protein